MWKLPMKWILVILLKIQKNINKKTEKYINKSQNMITVKKYNIYNNINIIRIYFP